MIEKICARLEEKKSHYLHDELTLFELGKSNGANYCSGKAKGIGIAIEIVQEVARDGGWIPCSERLPEDNGLEHYEITFLSGINKTPFRSVAIFSKGRWYMPGTYCRDCDWFPFEVIAWKKPSAPYQKGE